MSIESVDQLVEDPWNITVHELIRMAQEYGAGSIQLVARDKQEQPIACAIVIRGKEECEEILAAVAAVEARWELRKTLESEGDPL
jgi:hypothetical protein